MSDKLIGLKKLVSGLPVPASYYEGISAENVGLPENIVFFQRHNFRLPKTVSYHHRFMLIVSLEGSGEICVDEDVMEIQAGRGILVLPHQSHYFMRLNEQYHWLFVTFEGPENAYNRLRNLDFDISNIADDLQRIISISKENMSKTEQIHVVLSLALSLNRLELENSNRLGTRKEVTGRTGMIGKVIAHIHENLDRVIEADELAGLVGLSASHLQRTFRNCTGTSLGQFIRNARLNLAQRLMTLTNLTISEIVYKCGYESIPSFSNAFRKHTGLSPKVYKVKSRSLLIASK